LAIAFRLIVPAGFMRVLKGDLLRAFAGRIVNIHLSLLQDHPANPPKNF
jgi:folate-dependent phosphoribosylglycinamide formyltransferase PurN